MLNLAAGFARRGIPVDLLLAAAEGPYLQEVPKEVRIVDLAAGRVRNSILPLMRYLRQKRPAVLLTALDHSNCAAVLARDLSGSATKIAITLHLTPESSPGRGLRFRHLFAHSMMRYTHARADAIVAVSAGVADDHARLYKTPAARLNVIYNPVITEDLLAKATQPLDHPWFADGQPPVIVAVGRLTAEKDFANLVQAFAMVRGSGERCRLLILGEGELRPALEALIRKSGVKEDIALPGFVSNPFPYLARARLFVLSSRSEGLPTVLIEALAVGTPVVATNCRNGPAEILDNGKFGTLVPIENPAGLAAAIQEALRKNQQPPPEESWRRFDAERAVDDYLALFAGMTRCARDRSSTAMRLSREEDR